MTYFRAKAFVKRRLSHSLRWWLTLGPSLIRYGPYLMHPAADRSRARLQAFRHKHVGQRCFILGNGPSLRTMDLSRLRSEITFGLNRIYLLFDELGFPTTYYACVNRLLIQQCANDISRLSMPRFLSWHSRDLLRGDNSPIYLFTDGPGPSFSKDVARWLWEGATVTFVAQQLAHFMGFSEVILVGVDHHYQTQGPPHMAVRSEGSDPDHFSHAYFGKGFLWQLPDLATSELAFGLARQAFEAEGRRILDATVDGKLRVFPKVRFEDLF